MSETTNTLARAFRVVLARLGAKAAASRDHDGRAYRVARLLAARRRLRAKENGYVNAWRRWDA